MRVEFNIEEFVLDGVLAADSRDLSGPLRDQLEAELAEGGRRGGMLFSREADPPRTPWVRDVATTLSSVLSDGIRSHGESNDGGPE